MTRAPVTRRLGQPVEHELHRKAREQDSGDAADHVRAGPAEQQDQALGGT